MQVILHEGHEHATEADQAIVGAGEAAIALVLIVALAVAIAYGYRYFS